VIKTNWKPGYKVVFLQKIGLKFSKKIGIFPEWVFLHNKIFTFYAGILVQRSLEVSPGCMPSAPSNPPLIKWREAYWCYFSVLVVFLCSPPPENFSTDNLRLITAFKNK